MGAGSQRRWSSSTASAASPAVIAWQRASMNALAFGMVVTIPVIGLALFLTGGSLSYIEPFLVCSLLYAAFFFPSPWAWPLAIELILVAGTPLLYDPNATANAFVPRYLALAVSFLAATWVMVGLKKRLVDAEARQRDFANRDPLTGVGNRRVFDAITAPRARGPHSALAAAAASTKARSPCWSSTSTTSRASTTARPPGRRRGALREPPRRAHSDPPLDRHPRPDRRRRVRRDRPGCPRRGRPADGRSDPHRRRPARIRRPRPGPQRLGRLGRLPRRRPSTSRP